MKNWQLWALFVTSLVITFICKEGMTTRDGIVYMQLAELANAGEWSQVIRHPHHPTLAMTISFFMKLGFSSLVAGFIVCALSIGLALYFAQKLCILLFENEEAGRWTFFFLMCNAYILGAATNILSDPLYWAGLWGAITYFVKFWKSGQTVDSVKGGFLIGLCYLVRPEGLVVAFCVFVTLMILSFKHKRSLKPVLWGFGALLLTGSILVTSFYQETGEFRFTLKLSLIEKSRLNKFIKAEVRGQEIDKVKALSVDNEDRTEYGLTERVNQYSSHFLGNVFTVGAAALFVMIAALAFKEFDVFKRSKILMWLLAAFMLVVHLKWFDVHYLSSRHVVPMVFIFSIWAGPLFVKLKERWPEKVTVVFVFLVFAVGVGKASQFYKSTKKRERDHGIVYKKFGNALASRPENVILTPDNRVSWHAGRKRYVELPARDDFMEFVHKAEMQFPEGFIVVVNQRRPHNTLSYDDIKKGLLSENWQMIQDDGRLVAFVKQ